MPVFFLQVLCELEEKAGVILDERGEDIKLWIKKFDFQADSLIFSLF